VLALGAEQGTEVTLSADDDPEGRGQAAVDELAELLEADLDAVAPDV
jgi:phosphotransferase system HPr-like phosphotransfer protein